MRKFPLILLICFLFLQLVIVGMSRANAQVEPTSSITSESTGVTPGATPGREVQVSTPAADGSIKHKVSIGETLITIAEAYGLSLADLFELNGMNQDSVIYPGEELVIQAGFTPTSTSPPTGTATPTKIPTSTRRPTRTPQPQAGVSSIGAATAQIQSEIAPSPIPQEAAPDRIGNVLLAIVAVLGIGGVLLIAVGTLLRRAA